MMLVLRCARAMSTIVLESSGAALTGFSGTAALLGAAGAFCGIFAAGLSGLGAGFGWGAGFDLGGALNTIGLGATISKLFDRLSSRLLPASRTTSVSSLPMARVASAANPHWPLPP